MTQKQLSRSIQTITTFAFSGLALLLITSCAHKTTVAVCQELDWYELGRQDGAKGPQTAGARREVTAICEDSDPSLNEALYNNGFDSGVAHYCLPATGFELGRTGAAVADICPPMSREEFMTSYKRGQRYSEIENDQQNIENRLSNLNSQLSDKTNKITRRGLINGEKLELLEKKKKLEAERAKLFPEANQARN